MAPTTTAQRLANEAKIRAIVEAAKQRAQAAILQSQSSRNNNSRETAQQPSSRTEEKVDASFPENEIARFETDGNFGFISSRKKEEEERGIPERRIQQPLERNNSSERTFVWNQRQSDAIALALTGKSFCLIGAAGTGKTTVTRHLISKLQQAGKVGPLTSGTKMLQVGQPGIVVLSYTNRAVANIKKGLPDNIPCMTIHKLLEFAPEFYEVKGPEGEMIKTMRFEPHRNRFNPLPFSLKTIVIEESSMCSTELFSQLIDALPHEVQFIFLGDIQQLPPVYGKAILGFKLIELPTIELDEVYRQALESPILAFAWKILEGKPLSIAEIDKFTKEGKFKVRPWKKKLSADDALHVMTLLLAQMIDAGPSEYNPEEDMILIPFNKTFGTLEVNRFIANKLGKLRQAEVFEVIAGFQKHYFAVGDKVLVQKQEAIIEKISVNAQYVGRAPLAPSKNLNRWGFYELQSGQKKIEESTMSMEDVDLLLAAASADSGEIDERKNQGSHILHCRFLESDEECEVQTTGEYQDCLFSYALTVHKAQGSEWKRVLLILHQSHATMINRELLYTAVTRAKESLYIICEPEHFQKGILRQRIKGNTLAEKAEFFKGKLEELLENGNGKATVS